MSASPFTMTDYVGGETTDPRDATTITWQSSTPGVSATLIYGSQWDITLEAPGLDWESPHGQGIRNPAHAESDARTAMSALVSFLGAWDESRTYGDSDSENWDLFPAECEPWLAYVDDLTMDAMDHGYES